MTFIQHYTGIEKTLSVYEEEGNFILVSTPQSVSLKSKCRRRRQLFHHLLLLHNKCPSTLAYLFLLPGS
jgi:hypothetical protein